MANASKQEIAEAFKKLKPEAQQQAIRIMQGIEKKGVLPAAPISSEELIALAEANKAELGEALRNIAAK